MAIKVSGTIAIDDDKVAKNISKIVFADTTEQLSAGTAGTIGTVTAEAFSAVATVSNPNNDAGTTDDHFGTSMSQTIFDGILHTGADGETTTRGIVYKLDASTGTSTGVYQPPTDGTVNKYGSSVSYLNPIYYGFSVLSDGFSTFTLATLSTQHLIVKDYTDINIVQYNATDTYSNSILTYNTTGEVRVAYHRDKIYSAFPRISNSSGYEGIIYVSSLANKGMQVSAHYSPNAISSSTRGFGLGFAVNDDYIFAGAPDEPEVVGNTDHAGAIYAIPHNGGPVTRIAGTLTFPYDRYLGTSVAANDRYVFAGSPTGGVDFDTQYGLVRVYDAKTLELVDTIFCPDTPTYEFIEFGYNLKCNDQYLVISARSFDSSSFPTGKIYIYNANTLQLIKSITPTEYARFGSSGDINILGSTLAFSSWSSDSSAGKVIIHKLCAEVDVENIIQISTVNSNRIYPKSIGLLNDLV